VNVRLDRKLDNNDQVRIGQFSLDCGADRFTIQPLSEGEKEVLAAFSLGSQRLMDYTHPKLFSKKQAVWRLCLESLAALDHALSLQHVSLSTLTFYCGERAIAVAQDDCARFALWDEQRDYLFRLGFNISVFESGDSYREFTKDDLSENRRASSLPKITLDMLSSRGYVPVRPSRGIPSLDLEILQNRHMQTWWTPQQDDALRSQILRDGLTWWPSVAVIVLIADSEAIARWKQSDPDCLKKTWQDLIVAFARARAEVLELEKLVDVSAASRCSSCDRPFQISDNELRVRAGSPYFQRVPAFHQVCDICLGSAFSTSKESLNRSEMCTFARSLCETTGRIPPPTFGQSTQDFETLTKTQVPAVIRVLAQRPTKALIERTFGSWLQLLIESGVLEGEVRKTSRGTQCVANDGHVCLSLGEKVLDDLLHDLGIPHIKEVRYPGTNMRADFLVNGTYIEYFGLTGTSEYDRKTEKKRKLCENSGWKLLAIFPGDLLHLDRLRTVFLTL
jgi:hypothetical protein